MRKRLQYSIDHRHHAKNVLLFVGDGMGLATVTAARILSGQRHGKKGEDHELAWDSFPAIGLSKVGFSIVIGVSKHILIFVNESLFHSPLLLRTAVRHYVH